MCPTKSVNEIASRFPVLFPCSNGQIPAPSLMLGQHSKWLSALVSAELLVFWTILEKKIITHK